jgi:hypothetical protein
LLLLMAISLPAQVKIGDNPDNINCSAILELEKANMGLLIPRVSLASVWDDVTIPDPANSLLVYNTNFGGGPEPVSPGFYYWRKTRADGSGLSAQPAEPTETSGSTGITTCYQPTAATRF